MQRRLAAILAADVVGYSRLMGEDEAGTLDALKALRKELVAPQIAKHKGRVVKLMGDGLLAEFGSVVEAVECAVAIQAGMAERNEGTITEQEVLLRIGINLGDVIVEGHDIYGDGVNVAARLEGLAEPGGICISDTVHQNVRAKLELAFEDLGAQQVKNIAEPIHVYRIVCDGSTGATSSFRSQPSALPDKPSIAVLPFTNMSGDPDKEYFADGITENIITDLSRFRDVIVIARNSTFAYKGEAVDIQELSLKFGARYVLEGSIQQSADRVRITAQLIDGHTGAHLWAERYDRDLKDIFAVQDDVTEMIVGTLASGWGGRLRKAWQGRAEKKKTRSIQAFDCFMRGMESFNFAKDDTRRSGKLFEEAIGHDPTYAKPYAKLAWVHIIDAVYGWSDDYESSMAQGLEFATRGLEQDDGESWAHWALAGYHLYMSRHDRAISEFGKALELNPNDAEVLTDLGMCMSYAGRVEEGLELANKAMHINKHHPEWFLMQLGQLHYDNRQYKAAVATLESLRNYETTVTRLYLAAGHAALDQPSRAGESVSWLLELDSLATVKRWANVKMSPYANPADLQHLRDNLVKAGLPN